MFSRDAAGSRNKKPFSRDAAGSRNDVENRKSEVPFQENEAPCRVIP